MGLFSAIIKGVVRGARGIGGKVLKGLKSAGEKVVKGVKSGISKVKQMFTGKKPPAEPKLSQTLRDRGAFKPKPPKGGVKGVPRKPDGSLDMTYPPFKGKRIGTGQSKVPFEPPIKVGKFRPVVNKGRALNDPVMTRQPSGFMGESI